MTDDGSMVEMIIFAALAVFLVFKLRSVLGRRTGEERERSNPFDRPTVAPFRAGVTEPAAAAGIRPAPVIEHDPSQPLSLDARLSRVHAADPSFDEKHFLAGARGAFQMIVPAFVAGDLATLRPLLSSHLYGEFGRAISARPKRNPGDTMKFDGPVEVEISDAGVVGREVHIQVRVVSRQIHPGEDAAPEELSVDLWTFARDPGSRDPNWQLIETTAGH
jgi:predicted lipid-binding transport protein (Tim44 family)